MRSLRLSGGENSNDLRIREKENTVRALVLEVRDGTSACLKEDGTVVKVNKVYPVGQTIEIKENNNKILNFVQEGSRQLAMAVAAIACLFIGTGIFSYNNAITASYMSVDVNPSLEYSLNRLNKVIDVNALNDDAEPIVEALKDAGIVNSTVAETISETTRILEEESFIAEDKDNVMLVGITGADQMKSGDISDAVHSVSDVELADRVSVYTVETSQEEREEAKKRGVSAGRYGTAKSICDKNNLDIDSMSDEAFNELSLQSVASLLEENGDKEIAEAEAETEEEKEEKEDKDTKTSAKKPELVESKIAEAAVDEVNPAVTAQITTAEVKPEEDTEEEEDKSSSKKEKKSSKGTDKKTVSGASANSANKKDKSTVSNSDIKDGEKKDAEGAVATISDNVPVVTPSDTAVSDPSAQAAVETGITTVVAEDGTVVTVVVPENSLIENPQDMSVDEYEQAYKDKVAGTVPAAVTPAATPAPAEGTCEVSNEDKEKTDAEASPEKTESAENQ